MLAMRNGVMLAGEHAPGDLPELDRLSQFGDGVFETMLAVGDGIHLRAYHMDRLQRGLDALQISASIPEIESDLATFLDATAAQGNCRRVKLLVSRGSSFAGYSVSGASPTRLLLSAPADLPAELPTATGKSLELRECKTRLAGQPLLAGLKHCNRLEQVLARLELDGTGYEEGVMLDYAGNVVEAISANLFIVERDKVLTSPLASCGVAGVIRSCLLQDLLPALGIETSQENFPLQRALQADAVFISNATTGVRAVTSLTALDGARADYPGSALLDSIIARLRAQMLAPLEG